jgi:hypothetical protein
MVEGVMRVDTERKHSVFPERDVPHEADVPCILAGPVETSSIETLRLRTNRKRISYFRKKATNKEILVKY